MKITDIRVLLRDDDKLKAFVSVTFHNAFAVRGMKIIEGAKGTLLAMPSRKTPENVYVDVAFPINRETRAWLETHVMCAYQDAIHARANGVPPTAPSTPATCAISTARPGSARTPNWPTGKRAVQ